MKERLKRKSRIADNAVIADIARHRSNRETVGWIRFGSSVRNLPSLPDDVRRRAISAIPSLFVFEQVIALVNT